MTEAVMGYAVVAFGLGWLFGVSMGAGDAVARLILRLRGMR